ncbi:MAG: PKD domain-containing protein [Thermoplasmata archaeon]|nr:MAG: PKD domain-containing protein [Thermoplasmata archaeon]
MKRNRMLGMIAFCLMMLIITIFFQNVRATLEVLDLRVEGYAEGTPEIMHIINHEPVFSWTYEDIGGPYQDAYELEVWTSPNGTGTLMWDTGMRMGNATNVTYNDNGTALPLLDSNDYYVRVRISDPTAGWGPWNETMFHMNTPPPEPTSPNPPDNATGVPYGPNTTVSWSSGGDDFEGDRVYYYWEVAEDPSFSVIVASNCTELTISNLFSTSPGQTYYWHVIADDGWESTESPTWKFTTEGLENVDYILIRDEPKGGGINLCDPANYPNYYKGHTTIFYGAAYNHTHDYLGDVPVSSTWNSTDINIVTVTSPGSVSTISCNKTNSGTVTITLDDGEGHMNTTQVTVLPDNVDYIQIRDAPGGGGDNLSDPANYRTYPVGHIATFYGAAYNHSSGYMGDVPVTSTWISSNTTVVDVTSPGSSSTITCSNTHWGTVTITLDDGDGHTNNTQVSVMEPTTDYLLIRDRLGGVGLNLCDPANYKSYPVGASDDFYGAEYNNTAGYLGEVPGTSTWNSSDIGIVDVTSPGSSTTVTCNRTNWGTVMITLDDGSGHSNTTEVTVLEPTEDYIQIRDGINGLGNIVTIRTYIVWETDLFYAAGYNNTAGYLKDVVVEWTSDDIRVGTVTSPGYWTNFTAQKVDINSTCNVTADYNGITNSTGPLTVLEPKIDFITIVDSHHGTGQWVANRTYNEGENDIFWTAGFNYTADYVKDVKAAWESNNTIVGKVTYGPEEYTLFIAGWRGGYCKVTAIYGTLKNHTGQLYVINVNQLPTARAEYHNKTGYSGGDYSFITDITLRVTGRKENVITMELEEEGVVVEDITVTRHSDQPDTKTLSYEIDANKAYEVILNYNGHNGGSNPVIVTFEFLGSTYSVHLLLNSQHGEEQTASIDFNDIVQRVGVIFFDGFRSTDFEGYLVDYYWDFGDGTTTTGETLAHSYEENGVYTVTLTVTDDEGGIDSITITINIDTIDNNDQCNAAFGQNKEYMNQSGYYAVILQCPANLLITNQQNQQIGFFDDSQINTIEGAFVAMLFSDIEVYYVPELDTYTFEVMGTGSGLYGLSIISMNNGIAKIYSIYDVPCSKNSIDIYNFDFKNERFSITTSEDDIYYSLEFLFSDEYREDRFQLTNMALTKAAAHYYEIGNWDDLSSGKPVTFSLDEDSDGNIEKSVDLQTDLTGDEVELLLSNNPVNEPLSPILMLMVFGFVFTLGLGIFSTEISKWALLTMFLPLATRLKKRHMLDHPTRHEIYGYIMGNPGANFGLIKQELDLGNGQLVYHLKQLAQAHLIYSRQDGRKKRFYPMNFSKPKDGMYHLSNIQKKILGVIKNNSGVSQKKIASSIGVSHQVASYHLTKMERWGVVEKEVMGRERRYYISENPVAQ